jgi:hypothetical protein
MRSSLGPRVRSLRTAAPECHPRHEEREVVDHAHGLERADEEAVERGERDGERDAPPQMRPVRRQRLPARTKEASPSFFKFGNNAQSRLNSRLQVATWP